MNNDMLWLFKKGGSEKLIKKLKGLIKKLTNFEKRAAAGRDTGFMALPGDEEDTLAEDKGASTTIKRSGGQSKNLSQMISKHLPPEVKAFMKPGGYSKKLWGMALKHIPPEAKKFLKLGSGESITTRGITKKTGFIPLGRRQAKTRRIQTGPPSFMKGPHAQETQEQTAARYLREEEITQRGLAPDATEEEREAQQALEQRQRASSAGEGFFTPTTFMKKKGLPRDLKQRDRSKAAPALFTKRGAAAMAPGPGSPEKSKRDLEYEKNIKGMGLDPEAEAWALKQIKGGPKAVRGRIAEMEAMAPTLFPDAAAVSQKTGKGAMQANASVIKDVPPGEDVRSQALNLFSLNKPDPKAAKEMMVKFVKTGLAPPGRPDVDTNQIMLKKGGVTLDQPFEGLRLPKETDKYTDFKDKFEKESDVNDKPDDEVEKDISQLQEEGKKTTATLIELEKKLTELEKESLAETQGNRSPPESSTIDNFMNRTNRVVWSP